MSNKQGVHGHYHRPRVTICDCDQDEIKRSSRFPGENQLNDQSHLLTIHVRMQWAGPGFGWVKPMKSVAHQEIKLCFSSKSSDQSRFCGSKHFDRGHKW